MASELGVNTIQHTNGTDAITVGSTGIISQPNLPVFRVDKTADQSGIVDNTETVITFDDVTFDPENVWDTSNNRLTVDANTAGYWWFSCHLYVPTTTHIETAQVYFRKNGVRQMQFLGCSRSMGGSSGPSTSIAIYNTGGVLDLTSSGDYFDLTIVQDCSSGGTSNINNAAGYNRTFVQGYRLR